MKLRFNRDEMAEALRAICTVASTRTPKEILKCVKIEAKPDVLLLSATDLELSMRRAVTQVEVESPGEAVVVADTLSRIVSECSDDTLTIELTGEKLHIRGEGSHFQIVTQDPSEFPPVPDLEGDADFSLPQNQLDRLIEWTLFASARESTRYAINGVLWDVDGKKITLAATDGRRLSVAHGELAEGVSGSLPDAIVPAKAMSLFVRLPSAPDATVEVKIESNRLTMRFSGGLVSTALVEGHFPKYQDVIPADLDRHVTLNTAEFTGALKRAALLTNEESKGVRLTLAENGLTLSSRAPEQGEATITLPVKFEGDEVEIGFNPIFLLEALKVAHSDEIILSVKDANRPGMIKVGKDLIYVVMPVSLASN